MLRSLIRRWTRLSPVAHDVQCPVCGEWYTPSDSNSSYPHNNH